MMREVGGAKVAEKKYFCFFDDILIAVSPLEWIIFEYFTKNAIFIGGVGGERQWNFFFFLQIIESRDV